MTKYKVYKVPKGPVRPKAEDVTEHIDGEYCKQCRKKLSNRKKRRKQLFCSYKCSNQWKGENLFRGKKHKPRLIGNSRSLEKLGYVEG